MYYVSEYIPIILFLLIYLLKSITNRIQSEGKHTTGYLKKKYTTKPLSWRLRGDIPIAHCNHSGHSPINGINIPNLPIFLI